MLKDNLTQNIGVLLRRETEARILIPFIENLVKEIGKTKTLDILEETIKTVARKEGEELSKEYGNNVDAFLETLSFWTKDNALEIDILDKSDSKLDFNVTRCKYAEMYKSMGVNSLGAILSCNRDGALIEGFNKKAKLDRKQTIMNGDKCCTFRYRFNEN
jgi:predicted hydrocarbon binding protein|tara:strand:- start:775 stop:1254 length:480 start_codon:yes stop_codon:yes gene_type:complete